jgi:hypothetical protein
VFSLSHSFSSCYPFLSHSLPFSYPYPLDASLYSTFVFQCLLSLRTFLFLNMIILLPIKP